jgi:hypothetical protein
MTLKSHNALLISSPLPFSVIGEWHPFVAQYNSTTGLQELYYDCELLASRPAPAPDLDAQNLGIGGEPNNSLRALSGSIDELRLYDRALAPSEILTLCTCRDGDGDGILDGEDRCPASDTASTVIIGGCDTWVNNTHVGDGCTISDFVFECANTATSHGDFVSCVTQVSNDLKNAGIISGLEKGKITSCAARSDIP